MPLFLDGSKQEVQIGSSIGVAVFPIDAQDADALIKAADAAMNRARRVGNSFQFSASAPAGWK